MIGAVIAAVAMFGVGYWLGGSGSTDGAESPHGESTVMPSGGGPVGRLEDLLPALEAKVAANPKDLDQRMLLARTYMELGQREKGIKAFRALHKDDPKNHEIVILFATSLLESNNKADLDEARRLLDTAVRLKPSVAPMARLYQGEIALKLGDKRGAVGIWSGYLKTMSPDDPKRAMFEQRIAETGVR